MEKRSLQILLLLLLASLLLRSWPVSLGLILGGGIALLNFRWLWRIMEKYLVEKKTGSLFLLAAKFLALLPALFLALRYLPVDPVAFLVGISALVPGILLEAARPPASPHGKGAW